MPRSRRTATQGPALLWVGTIGGATTWARGMATRVGVKYAVRATPAQFGVGRVWLIVPAATPVPPWGSGRLVRGTHTYSIDRGTS